MTPLKSLAHPEWPYAGTAHEWRGFVKAQKAADEVFGEARAAELKRLEYWKGTEWTVYQKHNFGPELT